MIDANIYTNSIMASHIKQIRGVSYNKGDATSESTDGYIPVLRAGNICDSRIVLEDLVYIPHTQVQDIQLLRKGDILIATSSGSIDVVGKAALVTEEIHATFGAFCKAVRPLNTINPTYLSYFFSTPLYRKTISHLASGANINNLRNEHIDNLQIPIPYPHNTKKSLAEQRRIASILDKADDIRKKRTESIHLADEFFKSTFIDMFGDPISNSKKWPGATLSDYGEVLTGNTPSRKIVEYYGDHIEWIKSDNINTPSHILTEATEKLSKAGLKVGRHVPEGSTLVTCIAGSPSCIGNAAYTNRKVAFNQQINAISPHNKTNPLFLYVLILMCKKAIQRASTNGMKGMVSKSQFSAVKTIEVPFDKQTQFGEWMRKYLCVYDKLNEAENVSNELFNSLSQKAFKGEL